MNILEDLPPQVKGFLKEEEGLRLYELAREASALGPCLEIGSYCGKSTIYLGQGCKEADGLLFSIDHHRGSEEHQPGEEYHDADLYDPEGKHMDSFSAFRQTLARAFLEDVVVPIVARSSVAARRWATPLSLVFIDGGHSFEAAYADYSSWASHIMPSGYLVIHDIFKDPKEGGQAPYDIYRLALASGLFTECPMVNTLGTLKRVGEGKMPDHILKQGRK